MDISLKKLLRVPLEMEYATHQLNGHLKLLLSYTVEFRYLNVYVLFSH